MLADALTKVEAGRGFFLAIARTNRWCTASNAQTLARKQEIRAARHLRADERLQDRTVS